MGSDNSKPVSKSEVKKLIADGINEYASGCQKTMIATLIRNDGTIQELQCSGRARTFWLFAFGIINVIIFGLLLVIGALGSTSNIKLTKNNVPFSNEEYFIYCGVGFGLSLTIVLLSLYLWKNNVYGEMGTWARMKAFIRGGKPKERADSTFSYEMFQPCNTRRTKNDCVSSRFIDIVIPRTQKDFNKLPESFRSTHTFMGENKIGKKGEKGSIKYDTIFVEKKCEVGTKTNKKGGVDFSCNIKPNVDKIVIEDNLKSLYNKNLKLLPCNRRESQSVCENLKGKSCKWTDKLYPDESGNKKTGKVCKKKWKPFSGSDIWGCDECDDLSEFCTLSTRTWIGALLFPVCGGIMIAAGVELDERDDNSEDWIKYLAWTCYIGGVVTLLVGLAFIALSLMCPAGSDMFGQGVPDGGFYKALWPGLQ